MTNPTPAAPTPGRAGPPWTAEDSVRFYAGPLSNFATTPGLRLPFGYHGHHENDRVPVRTVEHWFQACKATSRQQFDLILACGTARGAASSLWSPTAQHCCSPTPARWSRTAGTTSSGELATPTAVTAGKTCSDWHSCRSATS